MPSVEIELFRADTPASKGITAAQLQDVVTGYDPDRAPAPVVMGHPRDDHSAPAFGAISDLRVEGKSLFGKIANLAKEAVDGVRENRILNRSVAFWHPSHPSNPTPGKLSLRHLGLLGGSPPAIPNLAPLRFAADEAEADGGHIVADGDPGEPMIFGAPVEQPAAPPAIDIDAIAKAVADKLNPGKDFAVATEAELQARQAELDAREAEFAAREQTIKDREAAAEKAARDAREAENATFAAQLVEQGKFPAGLKDDLAVILNALPTEVLQFSGDTKEAPAAALKRILGSATPVIKFETITPQGPGPEFSASGVTDADADKARQEADAKRANRWQGETK